MAKAYTKVDATNEESNKALESHAARWNLMNSGFEITLEKWHAKEEQAIAEGYKAEKCSCGNVFCAFHHFTTCEFEGCPFRSGPSLLDKLFK